MTWHNRPNNKYGNHKVELDGYTFDSKREACHYQDLKLRVAASDISDLLVHPKFLITVNDEKICTYEADFQYRDADGKLVVEDVKSAATRTIRSFQLKKKLVHAIYGITVVEVLA